MLLDRLLNIGFIEKIEFMDSHGSNNYKWFLYENLISFKYEDMQDKVTRFELRFTINIEKLEVWLDELLLFLKEGKVQGMMKKYELQSDSFDKKISELSTDYVGDSLYLEDDLSWHKKALPLLVYEKIKLEQFYLWNLWLDETDIQKYVRYEISFDSKFDLSLKYNEETKTLSFKNYSETFKNPSNQLRLLEYLIFNRKISSIDKVYSEIYRDEYDGKSKQIYYLADAINKKFSFLEREYGKKLIECNAHSVVLKHEIIIK